MNKTELLGIIKFQLGQLQGYLGIMSFMGVIYLVIQNNSYLDWYHVLAFLFIGIPVLLWFNMKYVYPSHQDYMYKKSPEWNKMRNEIRFLYELSKPDER
jgi:hypothetical protein